MKLLILRKFIYSLYGYFIWKKIKNTETHRKCCYWVFTESVQYTKWGLEFLKEFKEHYEYDSINFIMNEKMKELYELYENKNLVNKVFYITNKQYKYIECFYNVYGDKIPIVFISCDKPYGRNIDKYMNMGNIELKELFKVGVLGILE